jgi:hypothetical protein
MSCLTEDTSQRSSGAVRGPSDARATADTPDRGCFQSLTALFFGDAYK